MTLKETPGEALDRFIRDVSPIELERLYNTLREAAAFINEGNRDEAIDRLARVMSALVTLHTVLYLQVPNWCPPLSLPKIEEMLTDLRRAVDLEKRSRESGEAPSLPPKRNLMN